MLNIEGLSEALNLKLTQAEISTDELAEELGVGAKDIGALERGEDPHVITAFKVIDWLDLPLSDFLVDEPSEVEKVDPATKAEQVTAFLRSEREMKPENAEAVEAVLEAAYARFTTPA
jgi:transcriptional regulator with XRE-family HTH domain